MTNLVFNPTIVISLSHEHIIDSYVFDQDTKINSKFFPQFYLACAHKRKGHLSHF